MIEHTQTIYLSVFEHIMGLPLKGLIINISLIQVHIVIRMTSFIQKAIFFFFKKLIKQFLYEHFDIEKIPKCKDVILTNIQAYIAFYILKDKILTTLCKETYH